MKRPYLLISVSAMITAGREEALSEAQPALLSHLPGGLGPSQGICEERAHVHPSAAIFLLLPRNACSRRPNLSTQTLL